MLEEDEEISVDTEQLFEKSEIKKIEKKAQAIKEKYLAIPNYIENLEDGEVAQYKSGDRERPWRVGSWGQFNSFFPVKAALRILANLIIEKNVDSIRLDDFVKTFIEVAEQKELNKYRGFPSIKKGRIKDTAIGRFVWHFLTTAYEMGLIKIKKTNLDYDGLPDTLNDWNEVFITLTKEGLDFARLKNNILDDLSPKQVLTEEEKKWLVTFLKKIDEKGFKEYTFLKGVLEFLREGHDGKEDLRKWFGNNVTFVDYIKSWSRKAQKNDIKGLEDQIENLSTTFAGSKVALLRELGAIENRRNHYGVIGGL